MRKKTLIITISLALLSLCITTGTHARLKLNIQKRSNVKVEAEELPSNEAGFFDYHQAILPENDKDFQEVILESLRTGNKNNLAFIISTETLLLHQLMAGLVLVGKDGVLESVLKVHGTYSQKNVKMAKRYIAELEKISPPAVGAQTKQITQAGIQDLVNRFYADERVGEFLLGPQVREIIIAQLHLFIAQSRRFVKKQNGLDALHADIKEGLKTGVHDMYLAILYSKALQVSMNIEVKKAPVILLNNIGDASIAQLPNLRWGVDKNGRHLVHW
ncbi:MAG: hypothetical protein HQM16_05355 [Deltaproteobacteria bacterium]|nr:hypothetical protein [Deltaproteobacteria bacterium]